MDPRWLLLLLLVVCVCCAAGGGASGCAGALVFFGLEAGGVDGVAFG